MTKVDEQLDVLSRAVASAHSRRGVLKVGLGVVGGAVASAFGARAAWADPGGNSACAHFCNTVLPAGPLRGACASAGAHADGLCSALCQGEIACTNFCGPDCGCVPVVEGFGFCHQGIPCSSAQQCTTSLDCPSDRPVCALTCCAGTICVPACTSPTAAFATAIGSGSGLMSTG